MQLKQVSHNGRQTRCALAQSDHGLGDGRAGLWGRAFGVIVASRLTSSAPLRWRVLAASSATPLGEAEEEATPHCVHQNACHP
jgi:hypothetical protein